MAQQEKKKKTTKRLRPRNKGRVEHSRKNHKAPRVAKEIRKAERKLARRVESLVAQGLVSETFQMRRSITRLTAHIVRLSTMQTRLLRGDPAEVRTEHEYDRRQRERGPAITPRKVMMAPSVVPDPAPAPPEV